MTGTWYPSQQRREQAESMMDAHEPILDDDWETQLHQLAAEGDVGALEILREQLLPIDYEELGWGD